MKESYEQRRLKKKRKRKSRKNINRFIAIISIVLLTYTSYMFLVNVWKRNITVQLVEVGVIEDSIKAEARIIRNENVVYSSYDGNIQYFFNEGEKINKNEAVAVIKDNKIYSQLEDKIDEIENEILKIQDNRQDILYHKEEINELDEEIYNSIKKFERLRGTTYKFNIYDLRMEVSDKLNMKSELVLGETSETTEKYTMQRRTYKDEIEKNSRNVYSAYSGIVSYYIDGYEKLHNVDDILFDAKNPIEFETNRVIKSAKVSTIAKGEPVFKVIDDYNWYLICYIDKESYAKIRNQKNLNVRFPKINMNTLKAKVFDTIENSKSQIVILKMNEQLEKFLQFRDLNMEIILDKKKGLKILNDSIVNKTFFKIPNTGIYENKTNEYIVKIINGKEVIENVNVYFKDDNYSYIPQEFEGVHLNDLIKTSDNKNFTIKEIEERKGVYTVVGNIAKFKLVKPITQNEDYSIVDENSNNSVRLYDKVISKPQNIREEEFIQ